MITIEQVQAKVKEIFPKLHEGCDFVYYDNHPGFPRCHLVVVSGKNKQDPKFRAILWEDKEIEMLRQIDNLINETHKIYWG